MNPFETLRRRLAQRAEYLRIKSEIESLPVERAITDLGLNPYDAKEIARAAVYGR